MPSKTCLPHFQLIHVGCLEGVTLHEICRKLDEPIRVTIRFENSYSDVVTSTVSVFARHMQEELAKEFSVNPNRLTDFSVTEEGMLFFLMWIYKFPGFSVSIMTKTVFCIGLKI